MNLNTGLKVIFPEAHKQRRSSHPELQQRIDNLYKFAQELGYAVKDT